MPPKNYNKSELFLGIVDDSGKIEKLRKLSDVPMVGCPTEPESEYANAENREFTINLNDIIPINRVTREDLFLVMICGFDIDKIKQNNWHKLHNMPMKRRGCHGRRK